MLGDADDLGHRIGRRHETADLFIEGRQRDLITLPDHGMRQGSGHAGGVIELLLRSLAVPHRGAHIEKEMADEVRLHLILLDYIAFAGEKDPPVDMLRIIAPDVLTVAGEFHSEPRQG